MRPKLHWQLVSSIVCLGGVYVPPVSLGKVLSGLIISIVSLIVVLVLPRSPISIVVLTAVLRLFAFSKLTRLRGVKSVSFRVLASASIVSFFRGKILIAHIVSSASVSSVSQIDTTALFVFSKGETMKQDLPPGAGL